MLRITRDPADQVIIINLEGKLLGPWIEEVQAAVAAARENGAVRMNLEGLSFIDHPGVELLRILRKNGVELVGGSAFIHGLLAVPNEPS